VEQANLLLRQIVDTPRVRHILTPNQHVGAWYTGFMPQWITRDYLARKGAARFTRDQIVPARCSLFGYALKSMRIEGTSIATWFLQVDTQPEVGPDGYDAGADILRRFFAKNLRAFVESDLDPTGRRIIQCCMDDGSVEDYECILPEHRAYLMDDVPEMRCNL
jgi:hypothetical protein